MTAHKVHKCSRSLAILGLASSAHGALLRGQCLASSPSSNSPCAHHTLAPFQCLCSFLCIHDPSLKNKIALIRTHAQGFLFSTQRFQKDCSHLQFSFATRLFDLLLSTIRHAPIRKKTSVYAPARSLSPHLSFPLRGSRDGTEGAYSLRANSALSQQ